MSSRSSEASSMLLYAFTFYLLVIVVYLHACVCACLALVNKGNVMYNRGDLEKAREFYREALQNDSSCVEALYNFGNNTNNRPS